MADDFKAFILQLTIALVLCRELLFCPKRIKFVNYNTKSLTILLINQGKDSSKEDFELLQQKIEQLKEAEKVKRLL